VSRNTKNRAGIHHPRDKRYQCRTTAVPHINAHPYKKAPAQIPGALRKII
jgi:hypothetical protein